MGIVKISDEIHNELRDAAVIFDRSLNSQAEHWIKIGMLAEMHPSIHYEEIRDLLFKFKKLEISEIVKKNKKSDQPKNGSRPSPLSKNRKNRGRDSHPSHPGS